MAERGFMAGCPNRRSVAYRRLAVMDRRLCAHAERIRDRIRCRGHDDENCARPLLPIDPDALDLRS
jgi:hypothetical protein